MLYVGNGRYAMPVGVSSAGYAMQQPATQFTQNFTQQATPTFPSCTHLPDDQSLGKCHVLYLIACCLLLYCFYLLVPPLEGQCKTLAASHAFTADVQ